MRPEPQGTCESRPAGTLDRVPAFCLSRLVQVPVSENPASATADEPNLFEPDFQPDHERHDAATLRYERKVDSAIASAEARLRSKSVQLEKRGVTCHQSQQPLWASEVIFQQSILAKLAERGQLPLAGKMQTCHTEEMHKKCVGCGKISKFFNRCDLFFCPVCQPRLSRERKESVEWWTKQIHQPKHLVLTVRNTFTLSKSYVKFLKKQFSKLRKQNCWLGVHGGFYSLEVTNESRGWHLHFHVLCDSRWLQMSAISQAWAKLVGQDFAICKVKDCRSGDYLREVTKYAVKGSELAAWSGEQIENFITAFDGVRTFGVFGNLYGKRTEFSEWIRSIQKYEPTCSCGCSDFEIFPVGDDEFFRHITEIRNGHTEGFRRQVPIAQSDLEFDSQRNFLWSS